MRTIQIYSIQRCRPEHWHLKEWVSKHKH